MRISRNSEVTIIYETIGEHHILTGKFVRDDEEYITVSVDGKLNILPKHRIVRITVKRGSNVAF